MDSEQIQVTISIILVFACLFVMTGLILYFFTSMEKRNKILGIARRIFVAIVIPGSFASVASAALFEGRINTSIWTFFFGNEIICYSITSLAFLSVFSMITKKSKLQFKIFFAVIGAMLYTVEVFLINNLLHMVRFWGIFDFKGFDFWNDYLYFMRYDLNYKLGIGIFRYLLVFVIQLILFGIVILVKLEKVKQFFRYLLQKRIDK